VGTIVSDLLVGAAILIVLRLFLSKRGMRATVRSSLIAVAVGAVAYPLLVYVSSGFAAAVTFPNEHGWPSVEYGLARYGRSNLTDSVPRGAVMGIFAMVCIDLSKRRAKG